MLNDETLNDEIIPEQIVAEARKCLGTPWHHAGRLPGVGIDCAGLLIVVSREIGVDIEDDVNYTMGDEIGRMTAHIERYCRKLAENEAGQGGDILLFRARQMMNHCGFDNGEGGFIHAYNGTGIGRVVEHALSPQWESRLMARYRHMGVNDTGVNTA